MSLPFDRFRHMGLAHRAGLASILALAACDAGEPREMERITVRDSAGLEILEVDRDRVPAVWSVASEPEWVVGEEGLDLYSVEDVVLLDPDVLLIAEGSTQEVIRVDLPSGETVRWGGAGDGPEEFRGLARLFDLGEGKVGLYDRTRRRYVELDPDGAMIAALDLMEVSETADPPLMRMAGGGASGEPSLYLAERTGLPSGSVDGPFRGTGPVMRLGESVDTLTSIRGATTFVGDGGAGIVLFGATTLLAGEAAGLWIGDTAEEEVVLWNESGTMERVLRWRTEDTRQLTDARLDEFWTRLEAGLPEQERAMLDQMRGMFRFSDQIPAFGSLLADPAGRVWIGGVVPPERMILEEPWPAQEWLVFDIPAGEASRLTTPAGFQAMRVTGSHVLGVHTNELGVETVRAYRLIREEE